MPKCICYCERLRLGGVEPCCATELSAMKKGSIRVPLSKETTSHGCFLGF